MRKHSLFAKPLILMACVLMLPACSLLPGNDNDSLGSGGRPLEVPPDLTRPESSAQLAIPGRGAANYRDYAQGQRTSLPRNVLLPKSDDVTLQRDGELRWLTVRAAPAALWSTMLSFVANEGYAIAREDVRIGLIETQWRESGMVIGDSVTRSLFANLINSRREPGQRDRLRIRLEPGAEEGTTDVYLTRESQLEVARDEDMVWENRPDAAELEAESLVRLMVYLGQPEDGAASKLAADASRGTRVEFHAGDAGNPYLVLGEQGDRAWRLVGVALDRVGVAIEGRDRAAGIYSIRYTDAGEEQRKGLLSRLFTPDREPEEKHLDVRLESVAERTRISIQGGQGKPADAGVSARLLKQLEQYLR